MSQCQQALSLAEKGFHVFPVEANSKLPAIKNFPERATRNPDQIRQWFAGRECNIGISTSRFGDNEALLVVDIDVKKEKKGNETVLGLEFAGFDFPTTCEHTTPSQGSHLVYRVPSAVKQGVEVFGPGVDVRSRGGYVLAPGSEIDGVAYTIRRNQPPVAAPDWMVARCGARPIRAQHSHSGDLAGINSSRAMQRGKAYLADQAGAAVEGEGGDQHTYRVAARLKDFGCTEAEALDLLLDWNETCEPPWDADELQRKVHNAYRYGNEPRGIAAPEAVFPAEPDLVTDEQLHPFDKLNNEFAFVLAGGGAHILWETTDAKDVFRLEHLSLTAFHLKYASWEMQIGKKSEPVTELWLRSAKRRSYDGMVFAPERDVNPRFYNLWRGFHAPAVRDPVRAARSLEAFKEHALQNVCNGDKALCHWLMGYYAHMIQRPWEKPLTALVFKGGKGVGKNAICERVGALLGSHFMVADDDRYLLSNFNGHLEASLFMVLDEAAWAGDKRAEGRLKGLITGTSHNIEHKGKEHYKVDNLTRVAILGNEDWLVPASQDERRFAVFTVGDGRKQDRAFFEEMRKGMELGGYQLLLDFLRSYNFSDVDVNDAPQTAGLVDQKHASLEPLPQWWLDCLSQGHISGADFTDEWPDYISLKRLQDAFGKYCRNRNIRTRMPDERTIGRQLKAMAPSFEKKKLGAKKHADAGGSNAYFTPGIDRLRQDWELFIKGPVDWGD